MPPPEDNNEDTPLDRLRDLVRMEPLEEVPDDTVFSEPTLEEELRERVNDILETIQTVEEEGGDTGVSVSFERGFDGATGSTGPTGPVGPTGPTSWSGPVGVSTLPPVRFALRGKEYEYEQSQGYVDYGFCTMVALLSLEDERVDKVLKQLRCVLTLHGEQVWPDPNEPEEEIEPGDPNLLFKEVMGVSEKTQSYRVVCPTGRAVDAEVYGPDGEKMSGVEVVELKLDAKEPFCTATIKLSKVAVDVKANG